MRSLHVHFRVTARGERKQTPWYRTFVDIFDTCSHIVNGDDSRGKAPGCLPYMYEGAYATITQETISSCTKIHTALKAVIAEERKKVHKDTLRRKVG